MALIDLSGNILPDGSRVNDRQYRKYWKQVKRETRKAQRNTPYRYGVIDTCYQIEKPKTLSKKRGTGRGCSGVGMDYV